MVGSKDMFEEELLTKRVKIWVFSCYWMLLLAKFMSESHLFCRLIVIEEIFVLSTCMW